MSFADKLESLSDRAPTLVGHLATEEATKTALVLPFIAAMGYDVFDPTEVVPEFTADVGVKKGEKVDYAIKQDGVEVMLFECKAADKALGTNQHSQLYRYFSVTKARIAVLTNGLEYRFYSDLEEANRMDERPFLVLDLMSLRDEAVAEAQGLTKGCFSLDEMMSAAGELKYLREISLLLDTQFTEPEEDFVRFFHSRVSNGRFTANAKDQFSGYVKRALALAVKNRVSGRLRSALQAESVEVGDSPTADESAEPAEAAPDESGIVTTEEELEGFRVVRAIACGVLPADRVQFRDAKSYFAILVDNNNRKPICRLWFNGKQKYIGLLDADKKERRHPIASVDGIYAFADSIREATSRYAVAKKPNEDD